MIYLYKILTIFVFILILPILPFLYLVSEKRRATLLPRLGFLTGLIVSQDKNRKRIWIHALSVGEVKSAAPVVMAIKEKSRRTDIIFTASTKTGFEMAGDLFWEQSEKLVDQLGYFPLDFGFSIRRISKLINPDGIVLIETDLWPNFLYEMKKKKIPIALINARLSDRSFKSFSWCKPFAALFFSFLTKIFAQSKEDADRYRQLGINENKIKVTGNIKFDQPFETMGMAESQKLKNQLDIRENRSIILAGSTHEGEEQILLNWYEKACKINPNLLMIIAPRDPDRSIALNKQCLSGQKTSDQKTSGQISSVLMSQLMPGLVSGFESDLLPRPNEGGDWPQVIFVDKMGELSRLYAICDIAFIGGSLVAQGGHNPLEAAVYSKPILFGSDMSDFKDISTLLIDSGGAQMISSERQLDEQLKKMLEAPMLREQMGNKNFTVFSSHSGAVKKILSQMEKWSIV